MKSGQTEKRPSPMMERRSWEEFQSSGFLWWINRALHIFGWVIAYDIDETGSVFDIYPARVKYRGFDEATESEGFQRLSQYMEDNSRILLDESKL